MEHHIENGKKLGLVVDPSGLAYINIVVLNEITNKSASIQFMIDTGFNGHIQLSQSEIDNLGLVVENKTTTKLANGSLVEVGVLKTKVKMLGQEVKDCPIHVSNNGTALIGTGFWAATCKMLIVDYTNGSEYITLTDTPDLKNKIKKLIDSESSV